ncbi:MAG: MBOAT family protein [Bacteroidetes bacterium]|nr:MBOAT family protein [Bacteroidota bacterium]
MIFNSFAFFLFLSVVFVLYWFIVNKKLGWQNTLILVASYFFYGWWSWMFMGLLLLSTLMDYAYGFLVASPHRKKAKLFLWLSISCNLGILGVFKYYNFFASQLKDGFDLLGWHTNPVLLNFALPIGISFYTFHGMSYLFDVYYGKQKPVTNFIDYAVFVSFFPLLVAGPIERAGHLLPQVQKRRVFNYEQAVSGCRLILWGLVKKIIIADSLAIYADSIFMSFQGENAFTLIIGAVVFSFQIYADFSGYSDIALGTARLLGFELLSNFRFPYFSRDIAEFWRRWHISLSSWFRDYLYIPFGGSQQGKAKAVRNIFVIFLVSGFWHGSSWNFIVWGLIHACGFLPLVVLSRNRKHVNDVVAQDRMIPNLKELWQMLSTFAFVTFAWIFFRAPGLSVAFHYIQKIAISAITEPMQFLSLPVYGKEAFIYIVFLVLADWWLRRNERELRTFRNNKLRMVTYFVLGLLCFLFMEQKTSFIYFQF